MPLDELSGSESEADEEMEMEMFVNDAAAAGIARAASRHCAASALTLVWSDT